MRNQRIINQYESTNVAKRLVFSFITVSILYSLCSILLTQSVFAQNNSINKPALEGSYKIPILTETGKIQYPDLNTITDPAKLVLTIFQFAMGAAGILAIGMIVFGGIQYTVSAGNPAMQKDARDRILNAIYGVALLSGSFLILNTINPKLVKLSTPKLTSLNIDLNQLDAEKARKAWREADEKLGLAQHEELVLRDKFTKAQAKVGTGKTDLENLQFKTEAQRLVVELAEKDLEKQNLAIVLQRRDAEIEKERIISKMRKEIPDFSKHFPDIYSTDKFGVNSLRRTITNPPENTIPPYLKEKLINELRVYEQSYSAIAPLEKKINESVINLAEEQRRLQEVEEEWSKAKK
ncbi:MAG: hypothetical protein AAB885_02005 [Patescibacteria group bacterium]